MRVLGGTPPEDFTYELFLDEQGQKISKSKGNGLSVDEWLAYGPEESLALFMFQKPRAAKRLYFDVIPKAVDDYIAFLDQYHRLRRREPVAQQENPVWFIHGGQTAGGRLSGQFRAVCSISSAHRARTIATCCGALSAPMRRAPARTPIPASIAW